MLLRRVRGDAFDRRAAMHTRSARPGPPTRSGSWSPSSPCSARSAAGTRPGPRPFYLPLTVALLALIARNASIELLGKRDDEAWRRGWERVLFVASAVAPFCWGLIWTASLDGVALRGEEAVGGPLDVITPVSVLGGLTLVALCRALGAAFLALRTEGEVCGRAARELRRTAPVAAVLVSVTVIVTTPPGIVSTLAVLAALAFATLAATARGPAASASPPATAPVSPPAAVPVSAVTPVVTPGSRPVATPTTPSAATRPVASPGSPSVASPGSPSVASPGSPSVASPGSPRAASPATPPAATRPVATSASTHAATPAPRSRALAAPRHAGRTFAAGCLTIALVVAGWFAALHPAGLNGADGAPGLALDRIVAGDYTLTLMTILAGLLLPLLLAVQAWSYWLFRERVTRAAVGRAAAEPRRPDRANGGERGW